MLKTIKIILLLILPVFVKAQDSIYHYPKTFVIPQDIVEYSYDSLQHHSENYYRNLALVVQNELGLDSTQLLAPVRLVFISKELMVTIGKHNPTRFDNFLHYYGFFIKPSLIIIAEESDDTFMHEFMHALYSYDKIFQDIEAVKVHELIEINEGFLLGSQHYIEFLNKDIK